MSFLETIENARVYLERNARVSLRAPKREFELDDEMLEELIDELVEIQGSAVREERALAWTGGAEVPAEPPETVAEPQERSPVDYTPKHLANKILQSKSALEGTVNQYMGDGIMTLFGAPIAHEDHAQRMESLALA